MLWDESHDTEMIDPWGNIVDEWVGERCSNEITDKDGSSEVATTKMDPRLQKHKLIEN